MRRLRGSVGPVMMRLLVGPRWKDGGPDGRAFARPDYCSAHVRRPERFPMSRSATILVSRGYRILERGKWCPLFLKRSRVAAAGHSWSRSGWRLREWRQRGGPDKKRTVLVTGGAGFVGYHLCRRLLQDGWLVTSVDGMTSYYDVRLKERRLAMLPPVQRLRRLHDDAGGRRRGPRRLRALPTPTS